jgi:hypothetical protein
MPAQEAGLIFHFTAPAVLGSFSILADVISLSVTKTLFPIYWLLSACIVSIQVEAIPTEKKVRVRTPDFSPVKRPRSFKSEIGRRTSLGVLLLHALFLR